MSWFRTPLLALVLAFGCENNTITLETDPGPSDDSDADGSTTGGADTNMTATMGDTVGDTGTPGTQTLHWALSTPLAPGLPFQAVVTATPGNGTMDLVLQWVSLDIGSTTSPRELVGDAYPYNVAVDGSGTFFWDTGVILIPGAANPLTGEDLVASIQANVVSAGTPTYCGEAGGVILMPVEASLDVSTHAMTVVEGPLPIDFPIGCP